MTLFNIFHLRKHHQWPVSLSGDQSFCLCVGCRVLRGLEPNVDDPKKFLPTLDWVFADCHNHYLHIPWCTVASKCFLPWLRLLEHLWHVLAEQNQGSLNSKNDFRIMCKTSFYQTVPVLPWPRLRGLCFMAKSINSTLYLKKNFLLQQYIYFV